MSRLWLLGGRGWGEGDHEGHLWPAGGTLGREAGSPLCSQRAWMEAEGARWVRSPWAPGWPLPQQVELESGGGLSIPHCHLCLRAKTASSRAGPPPRAAAPGTRSLTARVSHGTLWRIPAVRLSCSWLPSGSFEVNKGGA